MAPKRLQAALEDPDADPLQVLTDGLIRMSLRNRDLIRWVIGGGILLAVGGVVVILLVLNSRNLSHKVSKQSDQIAQALAASNLARCQANNDYKKADKARWDYIIALTSSNPTRPQTPAEKAAGAVILQKFRAYNNVADAQVDCSKATKPSSALPSLPGLPSSTTVTTAAVGGSVVQTKRRRSSSSGGFSSTTSTTSATARSMPPSTTTSTTTPHRRPPPKKCLVPVPLVPCPSPVLAPGFAGSRSRSGSRSWWFWPWGGSRAG